MDAWSKTYLETSQMLETLNLVHKQKLARKVKSFILKEKIMYKVGQNNRIHRCLTTLEAQIILKELNEGMVKIHFARNNTTKKILNAGH